MSQHAVFRIFKLGVYAAALVCTLILLPLALLGQIVPSGAVFEMALSWLPLILGLSSASLATLAIFKPRLAALSLPVILWAAWPYVTLSKHQVPTGSDCPPQACLTIITVNALSKRETMPQLSAMVDRERADLVAINEAASGFDAHVYREVFPNHPLVIHASWETMIGPMGNPITLLSRQPVIVYDRILRPDTARRAYITADLGEPWQGVRIVVAHAMAPLSDRYLTARNTLLRAVSAAATEADEYILLGDFNLTAWSPVFRQLPGRRAGDPRLSRTWPTQFPVLGLSIDHIMASDGLELVEFKVLESIGSDHYPILARYKRAESK